MYRFFSPVRRLFAAEDGVATTEYVAVAAVFMIVGALVSYQIMGGADGGGLAGMSQSTSENLGAAGDDIDNILSKAGAFASGGS